MFYVQANHATEEIGSVTDAPRMKRRRGPNLRRSRDPGRVDRYYDRKARQVCTTCESPELVSERGQCEPCLGKARERTRDAMAKRRKEQRDQGLCATGCGRASVTYRCLVCAVRAGETPPEAAHELSTGVIVGVNEGGIGSAPPTSRSGHQRRAGNWRVGTDSSDATTPRYRGSAKRGSPSKAVLDQQDAKEIRSEIERAVHAIAHAYTPDVLRLPITQRQNALLEALSRFKLAARFIEELLDRHGYES